MPRVSVRPEPIDLDGALNVLLTHSQSSPGTFHITVELERPAYIKRFGGEVTILCSCRGFMNHRKCWHVSYLMGEEEE